MASKPTAPTPSPVATADGPKVIPYNYFDPSDFVEEMKCTTCKFIGAWRPCPAHRRSN